MDAYTIRRYWIYGTSFIILGVAVYCLHDYSRWPVTETPAETEFRRKAEAVHFKLNIREEELEQKRIEERRAQEEKTWSEARERDQAEREARGAEYAAEANRRQLAEQINSAIDKLRDQQTTQYGFRIVLPDTYADIIQQLLAEGRISSAEGKELASDPQNFVYDSQTRHLRTRQQEVQWQARRAEIAAEREQIDRDNRETIAKLRELEQRKTPATTQ